jgi:hypothetical protein
MQSSHAAAKIDIAFDEPNLIADAGLVPVVALAERIGLPALVTDRVKITDAANSGGANAAAKVMSLLAGMVAGADSIADTDRLRLAAMEVAFDGVRAPSTVGTFLRSFTHGHVRQLHSVHRQVLAELAAATPLLPGADVLAFVDIDSTHRQVYGYAKQGAAVGRLKGTKTLHPLLATISTPIAAPVIAGIRLRKGKAADVRGAAPLLAEALATAREAGCKTWCSVERTAVRFRQTGCPRGSRNSPCRLGCRQSSCMRQGTQRRRSVWRPGWTSRSCPTSSATRRLRSPRISTRMSGRRCTMRQPSRWSRCCPAARSGRQDHDPVFPSCSHLAGPPDPRPHAQRRPDLRLRRSAACLRRVWDSNPR